jgi:hypothetical protein
MGKAQQRVCMQCMQRIEKIRNVTKKFAMSPKSSQCRHAHACLNHRCMSLINERRHPSNLLFLYTNTVASSDTPEVLFSLGYERQFLSRS